VRPVQGDRGLLDPSDVAACFPPDDPHFSPVTLICAEDTANRGGGTVHPLRTLDALAELARSRGAAAHLDGARLFNAVVASGISAERRAAGFDTVSICLSKGLGAPVGSLLCGPSALMKRARRIRKALGGGMRQSGLLAAGGLYALHHNISRLAEDHRRARALADGLRGLGLSVEAPETNMVYVQIDDAPSAQDALAERGVACLAVGPDRLRLVIHRDIDDAGIDHAISSFAALR